MDNNSHISRRIIIVIAVLLLLTAGTLVGLNAWSIQRSLKLPMVVEDNYTKGYLAARAKYANLCPTATNSSPTTISGTIADISDNSFILVQDSLDTDEHVDGISDRRTVVLSADTKISSITTKTAAEISAELAKQNSGQNNVQPLTMQTLSASSLTPGTRVTVTSNQNVRFLNSIPAMSIVVSPR